MPRTTLQPQLNQRSIGENCAKLRKKLKNTVNLQRKPQLHQKPPLLHGQPDERKDSNSTEQITRKQQETSLHRTKLETNGGKMRTHRTKLRQTADDGCTSTQPRKNFENLHELTLWMGASFTQPHGGCLMILPVDQNAGNCLVKGSTCAPLQTSVPLRDPPQEPAKETERRRCGRSHSNAQVSDRITKY